MRYPGEWVFPGGGVDEGEDARAAAARELAEELGIELTAHEAKARLPPTRVFAPRMAQLRR